MSITLVLGYLAGFWLMLTRFILISD